MGNASSMCVEAGYDSKVAPVYINTRAALTDDEYQSVNVAAISMAEREDQRALKVSKDAVKAENKEEAVATTDAEAVTPAVPEFETVVPAIRKIETVIPAVQKAETGQAPSRETSFCDDVVSLNTATSLHSESTQSAPILEDTYSSRKECEFSIHLTRKHASVPWGFKLKPSKDGSMVTLKMPTGASIARWLAANPDMGVRQADELISVNEVACNDDLQNIYSELKVPNQIADVRLRRQLAFSAMITCTGKLGIKLHEDSLEVIQILEKGDVVEYNKQCYPNVEICVGDTLKQVGNVLVTKDNLVDELNKLKEGDSVDLLIKRPAPGSFVKNPSIPAYTFQHTPLSF